MAILAEIKSFGNDVKSFGKEALNHLKTKNTKTNNETHSQTEKSNKATALYAIAGIISLVAAGLFILATASSAASTIAAGVSGVGAPGIVPGVFATCIFAGCAVGSVALAAYCFSSM